MNDPTKKLIPASLCADEAMRLVANRQAVLIRSGVNAYAPVLEPAESRRAHQEISGWPVYEPTPLQSLDGLASALGVRRVWAKNEGLRQPLSSFKALGGAYALGEAIRARVALQAARKNPNDPSQTLPSYQDLFAGRYRDEVGQLHATCASDGNHGRSVAWGARLMGAACTVYLGEQVSSAKQKAIEAEGAAIVRVAGTYDEAVDRCAEDASSQGHILIQDTSYPGYIEPCAQIMHGYSILAAEALSQLPEAERPSHVFLQVGCGGLAGAVAAHLADHYGDAMPVVVAVQSVQADPLLKSFEADTMTSVDASTPTRMTGVAVGHLSLIAWQILQQTADFAVAISDQASIAAARLLAGGVGGDKPLVASETGASGVAALIACMKNETARQSIGLDANSRVLTIITESANDPQCYAEMVGLTAEEVLGRGRPD